MQLYVAHVLCLEDNCTETYINSCPDSWTIDDVKKSYTDIGRKPIFVDFTCGYCVQDFGSDHYR